jgi:SWIM zinc finger
VSLTRERIESLAPDQASLAAALKLVKPANWPVLAASAGASVLWGECQGSGATPYRVVVSPEDIGYKCTCPSRKFPCKHVLAVLWLRVDRPDRFETASPPQWVEEWSARRRPGGGGPRPGRPKPASNSDDGAPREVPSLDAALAAEPVPAQPDPKAAARAEAQRQRVKAERESAVLGGLDELDRWILDQLSQGLAGFAQRSQAAVRTLSTRLVDAKAGGLAARLDNLATELFRVPEDQRADLAIERLATMTLIASAYRHQDRLPPPLREDVRRATGWSVRREDLLADTSAPRVTATWIVAANLSEVQPDKLRRLETWLVNASAGQKPADNGASDKGPADDAPRVAVLIDFVPVSGGAFGFAFEPGECIEGEVVFYPSAAPLRGLLATRKPAGDAPWPKSSRGVGPALEVFARRLGALPWLDSWPLMMDGVAIRTAGKGALVVTDDPAAGDPGRAIPIASSQVEALTPMLGLDGLSLVCLWDGRTAQVLAVDTAVGRWHGG